MFSSLRAASSRLVEAGNGGKLHYSDRKASKHRVDIVSPTLCDDVLTRLGPSLARHTGCTLIDIHPGRGHWSSKLHELIKPRTHILAEPRLKEYLPHLQPLLDRPGSRYCLVDWEDKHLWKPQRYKEHGLLRDFHLRQDITATTKNRNDSLLIMANMAVPALPKRFGASSVPARSHRKLLDYAMDVKKSSGFQADGPVRLLMWLPMSEQDRILPRSVEQRNQTAFHLEATCLLEEIVSGKRSQKPRQHLRNPSIELDCRRRVSERMRTESVYVPPGRRDKSERPVHESSGGVLSSDIYGSDKVSHERTPDWLEELQSLRMGFRDDVFGQFTDTLENNEKTEERKSSKHHHKTHSPEYQRMMTLERHLKTLGKRADQVEELLREQSTIESLTSATHNDESPDHVQRAARTQELNDRRDTFRARLDAMPKLTRMRFELSSDDRKAFSMNPPLLMWDRRKADPMIARKEEFEPHKELCLLDIEPRNPYPYSMTSSQTACFELIASTLLRRSSQKLSALDQIAPGAVEALAPKVPALWDLGQGWEEKMGDLRVRCITADMVYQLAVAWDQWPFKPDPVDIMTKFGGQDE
ncbi:MAG: hypothetical protein Q9167_000014 [Letrouitia subvulpina]